MNKEEVDLRQPQINRSRQLKAMIRKNFTLKIREPCSLIGEFILSIIFGLIVFYIIYAQYKD